MGMTTMIMMMTVIAVEEEALFFLNSAIFLGHYRSLPASLMAAPPRNLSHDSQVIITKIRRKIELAAAPGGSDCRTATHGYG